MDKVAKGMYVELIYDLYKIEDDGTEELVHCLLYTSPSPRD